MNNLQKPPPMLRRWLFLLVVALIVIAFDQYSKRVILNNIVPYDSIPLLAPVLFITHTNNTGAAFGFLSNSGAFFLVVPSLIVGVMLYFYTRSLSATLLSRVATGLVIGGALGNLLDRLQYGHVIDFVHIVIPGVISNVSNFADHAIVLGVLLIFFDNWRTERRQKREQHEQQSLEAVKESETEEVV
jgi:signal peptidase II